MSPKLTKTMGTWWYNNLWLIRSDRMSWFRLVVRHELTWPGWGVRPGQAEERSLRAGFVSEIPAIRLPDQTWILVAISGGLRASIAFTTSR